MAHIFLEISGIDPGLKTPADLSHVLRDSKETTYSITPELVHWIKGAIAFRDGQLMPDFKNCCFAFGDGKEFIEFDGKGKIKPPLTKTPDWYPEPGEFMRETWLKNKEMHDQTIVQFIKEFLERFTDVNERRVHCDLLFNLQLGTINTTTPAVNTHPPASRIGNKNRLSTQPKVHDLNSFEMFSQFFSHLSDAVLANQFPTMQVLIGQDDISKAPTPLKGATRTWFKAITGELPPNNKKVAAGHADVFCAPIQTTLLQIKEYGLEKFYAELSQAIQKAGDLTLDKFEFQMPKQ